MYAILLEKSSKTVKLKGLMTFEGVGKVAIHMQVTKEKKVKQHLGHTK